LLTACAAPEAARQTPASAGTTAETETARPQPKSTATQLTEAAKTPLGDLNLLRPDIPPVLVAAQKGPYALPKDPSCSALAAEIRALDAVLGADLDIPPEPDTPSVIKRSTEFVSDAAFDALRGAAEGVIPYRGWVRKLTGAERHSKEVAAAIAAGTVRRSYLKGLGQAIGCQAPAAPRKPPEARQ
jgi:hypothetical protein